MLTSPWPSGHLNFLIIFAIICLFLINANPLCAQTPQDALDALKKLQARCTVGISYADYCRELGDALHRVDRFIESPAGRKSTQLSGHLKKAFGHYLMAQSLWKVKFHAEDRYLQAGLYPVDDAFMQEAMKIYPKLRSKIQTSPAYHAPPIHISSSRYIDLPDILSVIWNEAARQIQLAETFL